MYDGITVDGDEITFALTAAPGTCRCGCGRATRLAPFNSPRRGWVRGEPQAFLHAHRSRPALRWVLEDHGFSTPCWTYQGWLNRHGYGEIGIGGARRLMHRWAYETFVGSIPVGLQIDHLCRNRACSRPDHLEPVTQAENLRRGRESRKITGRGVA